MDKEYFVLLNIIITDVNKKKKYILFVIIKLHLSLSWLKRYQYLSGHYFCFKF